jgi:hypothetical protein
MQITRRFSQISFKLRLMISSAFLLLLPLLLCGSDCVQPPQSIPNSTISVVKPADYSIVRSPIFLEYEFYCQTDMVLRIELIDQNQTLLYRKLTIPNCQSGELVASKETIFFDTTSETKFARLSINAQDAQEVSFAVTTSQLNLSDKKQTIINATDRQNNFLIISPANQSYISGGDFQLSGWARVKVESPVILELITTSGGLIASRQIAIPEDTNNDYFYFETNIPYKVNRIQDVYLVIRQIGIDLPGNIALERATFQIGP